VGTERGLPSRGGEGCPLLYIVLIHPGLGVVCAAFALSYPQLQPSLPLRSIPLAFRLLWVDYPRLFPPLVTLIYPSFVLYPCLIPTSPQQRSGSPPFSAEASSRSLHLCEPL